jgi:hypothetical protein
VGVVMDSKMSFAWHIDDVMFGKVSGFVKRLSDKFKNFLTLKTLYVAQERMVFMAVFLACTSRGLSLCTDGYFGHLRLSTGQLFGATLLLLICECNRSNL